MDIFSCFSLVVSKLILIFAPTSATPWPWPQTAAAERWNAAEESGKRREGEDIHILKVFANASFLFSLNVGNSNLRQKQRRGERTGRYKPSR